MTKEEYIRKKIELTAAMNQIISDVKIMTDEYKLQLRNEYKDLIGKTVRCYDDYNHGQYLGDAYLSDVDICEMPELKDVVAIFRCHGCKKDGTMSQRRFSVTRIEPIEEK